MTAFKKGILSNSLFGLALGLIAVSAMWIVKVSTPVGLGLNDDSIAYIAGARGILQGIGYRQIWLVNSLEPITHFPPMYSYVLALVGLSGLDPLRGTRLVNILLFGMNATTLGLLGWKMTRSKLAGTILALLFALNSTLLGIHIFALSEPLYLLFSLSAFLLLAQWFETERAGWLLAAGVVAGFAYLTRYAGLALLATFAVALLLLHPNWRKRLRSLGIFFVGAIPWMLAWIVRNRLLAGNTTNRTLDWHPITPDNIQRGVQNLSGFLVPIESWYKSLAKIPGLFEGVLGLIGLALLAWVGYVSLRLLTKPGQARKPEAIVFTNGLYVFGYLGSLVVSMSLFDASTKFKDRILSPVYVAGLILLVAFGYWIWGHMKKPGRGVLLGLTIFVLGVSSFGSYQKIQYYAQEGQGFASWKWYDSKTMEILRQLPQNVRIYTNQPGAVYLYTGRPCLVLPTQVDPVTDQARMGDYLTGVQRIKEDVIGGRAALVLFKVDDIENLTNYADYPDLTSGLPLAQKIENNLIYMTSGS